MARPKSDQPEVTPTVAEAAKERAAAAADPQKLDRRTKQLLDALAAERRGYVARGLDDRVRQVDEQINRLTAGPAPA